jgi:hemin uptake protein HemP
MRTLKTDELTRRPAPRGADPASPADRPRPRRFDAAELFAGTTEIEIVHEQAVYRLKITRQGKLILNK